MRGIPISSAGVTLDLCPVKPDQVGTVSAEWLHVLIFSTFFNHTWALFASKWLHIFQSIIGVETTNGYIFYWCSTKIPRDWEQLTSGDGGSDVQSGELRSVVEHQGGSKKRATWQEELVSVGDKPDKPLIVNPGSINNGFLIEGALLNDNLWESDTWMVAQWSSPNWDDPSTVDFEWRSFINLKYPGNVFRHLGGLL